MEALPDELVEAILLRCPPDDPALLARAALVCKRWCRLVSGRGFRRRLRQLHRTAPMLGLLQNTYVDEEFLFVPTSSFRPPHEGKRFRYVIDVRHGHVLHHGIGRRPDGSWGIQFAVWDPITGHETKLPTPIEYLKHLPMWSTAPSEHLELLPRWSAAVLCAAAGGDACDHLDCHRGPFQVVIVCCDSKQAHACVYSSVTGAWRQPVSSRLLQLDHEAYLDREPANAFVCDALFFEFGTDHQLLRYDLASEEMSVINPPCAFSGQDSWCITAEDGRVGFATVEGYKLYLWSREASSHGGDWTEASVIELEKLLPVDSIPLHVVGFADGVGIFIVDTSGILFTIDLKSSQIKEVCNVSHDGTGDFVPNDIFPYMTFLTPAPGGTLRGTKSSFIK